MSAMTAAMPLIEETLRGPYVAGTRLSIYSIMDYIKAGHGNAYILEMLPILNQAQLDAVYDYIEQHKEDVERDYERVLRRCAELEARYRKVQAERSPYPPDMPLAERKRLMIEKLQQMGQQTRQRHDSHNLA
jgi:uncharacterized protein (DUF433 family)